MYTFAVSVGWVTTVWVCDPRHVCTLVRDVGDVKDADSAQPLLADRVGHALRTTIVAPVGGLPGHEHQVAVHRDVALRGGADIGRVQGGVARLRDVPHLV